MLAVAARQHGVVSAAQLRARGVSRRRVQGLEARGELRRLHKGVYLVGQLVLPHSLEAAAILAGGPQAAISHRSAAYLYTALAYRAESAPIHLTIPSRRSAGDRDLVIHQATLLPHEIRHRHGIPVTSPTRTILDLASCSADDELESAVAEAFALRLVNRSLLITAVEAAPGRRGVARLRTLLEIGPKRTRSKPERDLLKLIRAAGLPEPLTNHRIGRWELDLYWPEHRLVVEVDAYSTHSSPRAFENDRRKAAELEDAGLTVRRVTRTQIRDHADTAIARITRELAAG